MGLSLIALACLVAQPTVGKAEPLPEWNAPFAGGEGWIGGDGAYSVPFGKDRVLWLFGDTLIGKVKDGGRAGSAMINHTAAVQTGRGADAKKQKNRKGHDGRKRVEPKLAGANRSMFSASIATSEKPNNGGEPNSLNCDNVNVFYANHQTYRPMVHPTLVSACKGIRVRVNCCVRIAPVPTGAQRCERRRSADWP